MQRKPNPRKRKQVISNVLAFPVKPATPPVRPFTPERRKYLQEGITRLVRQIIERDRLLKLSRQEKIEHITRWLDACADEEVDAVINLLSYRGQL